MRIEMWPIERVRPYDKNPRINENAVASVAASLQEFGFRQPIVVDEQDTIIVGHTAGRRPSSWDSPKFPSMWRRI